MKSKYHAVNCGASRSFNPSKTLLLAAVVLAAGHPGAHAATKYFDSTAGAGNGVGGSGALAAQTTALYSNAATGDAALSAAAATDDGVFQGAAGTVTLTGTTNFVYTLNTATFNTTNYSLTVSNSTASTFAAPITLAASVNLNLLTATTSDRTLGVASIGGSSSSTITILGAQTNSGNLSRVNLAVANAAISLPTTITSTGTSDSGYVATATGTTVSNTIANSSTSTTLIGATSGNDLTLSSAAVISGSAGVLFAAGNSGGAGLVTINSANGYTGATTLNNNSLGVIRIGVDNALPTTTALQFGITAQAAGSLDLNGHSQTVGSLAYTGTTGSADGIVNTSANPATLIVSGGATTSFSGVIGVPANATGSGASALLAGANNGISLTLAAANTGSLTLSAANTYTGTTKISGGTLVLSATGSINGSTLVQVTSTGALTLNNAAALSDSGTLTLTSGATLNLNAASGTSEIVGALMLDGTAEGPGTYMASQLSGLDSSINFNSPSGETLTVIPEPTTIMGGVLIVLAVVWSQRRLLGTWRAVASAAA